MRPEKKIASRLHSPTLHIVIGVVNWYPGMTATSECGVKHVDVHEENADRNSLPDNVCKRCIKILGWDL